MELSQRGHAGVLESVHNLMRRQAMTLQTSSDAKIEVIRQPQQLPCTYIDANGREVQITEEMIQQACSELEQRLVKPAQQG